MSPPEDVRPATNHDRYRQLFEQNTAVQLLVDPADGAIVDANGAAANFYGQARDTLTRRRLADLAVLPDDDILQTLEVAAQVGAHSYAFPHRHATGEVRLVEIYAGPVTSDGRALVHMIVHDVTERVQAEAAARELHAERVAHQRTVSLHEELRRRETLSRIGELVAAVAHEVRNPLFAISSTLDAMRVRVGESPDFQRYYPALEAQVERLSVLMQDLLEYGKPASLTLGNHSASDLLNVAIDLSRVLAATRQVQVTGVVPRDVPSVRVDKHRIVQVLQNLIANAIQHSPAGGTVEIIVSTAERANVSGVRFEVLDRGAGFAESDLPRVFEPFFSRRIGGTGMGLALAYRLAHDHEGSISAANREFGGARLTLWLPLSSILNQ